MTICKFLAKHTWSLTIFTESTSPALSFISCHSTHALVHFTLKPVNAVFHLSWKLLPLPCVCLTGTLLIILQELSQIHCLSETSQLRIPSPHTPNTVQSWPQALILDSLTVCLIYSFFVFPSPGTEKELKNSNLEYYLTSENDTYE